MPVIVGISALASILLCISVIKNARVKFGKDKGK